VYAGDELEVEYSISDKRREILKGTVFYQLMLILSG